MYDQDRISPYNIDTMSCGQLMRIRKSLNEGIISWSYTKFSNFHHNSCMADGKEITHERQWEG